MRIATGRIGGRRVVGQVSGETFRPLRLDGEGERLGALAVVRRAVACEPAAPSASDPLPLSSVTLEAPVPRPLREGLALHGTAGRRIWRNVPPAVVWTFTQ